MRSILGFGLSFAVSILVTWAGLHYDNALAYLGVALIALVFILFIWSWAFATPAYSSIPQIAEPDWTPQDEKSRALLSLKRARDSARIAVANRSESQAHAAFNEIQAALLSTQRHFGIGQLTLTGEGTYRDFLTIYLPYIDVVYPRLREGHVEQALAKAKAFKWSG